MQTKLTAAQLVSLEINAIMRKCQVAQEQDTTEAEQILSDLIDAQTKFWDLSFELEKIIGVDIDTTDDLSGYTLAMLKAKGGAA